MLNQTHNYITTILFVLFYTTNIFGQSVKDFYIPSENYNKTNFYNPDKEGKRTDMTRVIYYLNNGDGSYDIIDSPMYKGKPSAITTKMVEFSETEVRMIKSISTTILETNKKNIYQPSEILLKMPLTEKTASWSIADEAGGSEKFTASWTSTMINGKNKKTIKLVSQYSGWKSKKISFYVEGIGLYKTEIMDEFDLTSPSENFDGLSYEKTK